MASHPFSTLPALALLLLCSRATPQEHHQPQTEAQTGPGAEAPASPRAALRGGQLLSISRQDGRDGARWTLLCEQTPLEDVLRALSKKAGLALEGTGSLPLGGVISADLSRRPLEQVLEFVLGSQGLRYELARGTLRLLPATNDEAELLRLAQGAWRAVEAGGDAQAAGRAKLAQGNLLEVRGDLEGAYRVYAELATEHGEEAAEATYRAGRILQRLGHWAEAAQHFRLLASLEGAVAYHAKARLELARVSIKLGDAKSALHVLNFLEANYPTLDSAEQAERRLVRASACNAQHEYVEALRTLEEGEVVAALLSEARSLEIRAVAFEGLGFEVEAARAWLVFARESVPAEERVKAFQSAARLSLAAGDELGALFVCREAARLGDEDELAAYAHDARLRLGLDEDEVPGTIQERLELAEGLLARGELTRCAELFEGLYLARGALPEPEQARVLAGWAEVQLGRVGLQAALDTLAAARALFEDPSAARKLDLAAAALLESEGHYDAAAEAYRGVY